MTPAEKIRRAQQALAAVRWHHLDRDDRAEILAHAGEIVTP